MALTPVTVVLNETGKTVQPTTKFGLRKCCRTDAAKDWISKLPDDVLVSILSLLKLKEAARTSVLSNRWRYVWTSIQSLDFYDSLMLQPLTEEELHILRCNFIDFVNKVLKSHHGPTLDEFRINFDMDDKECFNIENWIKFALERGVKRLVLSLKGNAGYIVRSNYALTTQFLRNYRLDSIKSLHLLSVDVTEEVLDYLLSHCPSLEFLYMAGAKSLVNLKVSGPSLRLKHLEILLFHRLKNIEISDIDLVVFKYTGYTNVHVHFKNVPHLAELSLNGESAVFLLHNSWLFSTLLSKLEMLILSLNYRRIESFNKFPELTNLRKLELKLNSCMVGTMLRGTSLLMVLLEVSPLLHTLVLVFRALREGFTATCLTEVGEVPKANGPHQCLKVFKLVGFIGCELDIQVAKNIINAAVSLEKIIIDASSCYGNPEERLTARTRARQLETVLPLGAKLEIL